MSKITKLTTASLGMVIQLILDSLQRTNKTELLESKQYIAFALAAQGYLNGLNKVDASVYSPEVAKRDKQRDIAISALYKTVKSLTTSPVARISVIATRVLAVLKVHGSATSICRLRQGDKTSVINSLLAHLKSAVSADDLAILTVIPWIDAVVQSQADYLAVYVQRSSSNAKRSTPAAGKIADRAHEVY